MAQSKHCICILLFLHLGWQLEDNANVDRVADRFALRFLVWVTATSSFSGATSEEEELLPSRIHSLLYESGWAGLSCNNKQSAMSLNNKGLYFMSPQVTWGLTLGHWMTRQSQLGALLVSRPEGKIKL